MGALAAIFVAFKGNAEVLPPPEALISMLEMNGNDPHSIIELVREQIAARDEAEVESFESENSNIDDDDNDDEDDNVDDVDDVVVDDKVVDDKDKKEDEKE